MGCLKSDRSIKEILELSVLELVLLACGVLPSKLIA
jgi:hypothetical protein